MCDQHITWYTRTDVSPDSWAGVSDRKKRKQIQDRLAQRTRRRRLAHLDTAETSAQWCHTTVEDMDVAGRRQLRTAQKEDSQFPGDAGLAAVAAAAVVTTAPDPNPDPCASFMTKDNSAVSPLATVSLSPFSPPPSISTSTGAGDCLISHANNTVFTALFKNGRVLGLPCGSQISWKSNVRPGLPASLQPTLLQITTMHTSWIDRFPFPQMRDNFIRLNALIDEEEFLQTLFDTHSFTIVPGTMSWDPNGWIMTKEFADKWGYLFY